MSIAFVDVDYRDPEARAACIVAADWSDPAPQREYVAWIGEAAPYESGHFYRRELPCLMKVLALLVGTPATIVIDGHVWLSPDGAQGLGARLHAALEGRAAVVGVAKTAFRPLDGAANMARVLRGGSVRPLHVTCVGMALDVAAEHVRTMHGTHRIPELIRRVDRLARDAD